MLVPGTFWALVILKEKFIPKWQFFFSSPTKRLHKGGLVSKISDLKVLSATL